MSAFPDLTPTLRRGDPRCGSKTAPDAEPCGAPATWHVAWWLTPKADFSLLCDKHMAMARRDLVYVDQHPATVACDMPGTGWLLATPSLCVLATTDDVAARAREAQR